MKSLFSMLLLGAFLAVAPALSAQTTTLADLITEHPDAGTLAAAVAAANLESELRESEDLVLLMPSDAAFSALPEGTVAALLRPANQATLRSLLVYHLISADADGATIMAERLQTAEATPSDPLEAANGKAYLIDRVLLPPGFDFSVLEEE